MKTTTKLLAIAAIVMVSMLMLSLCSDNNSSDKYRIAQLEAKIAQLEGKNASAPTSSNYDSESINSSSSSTSNVSSSNAKSDFVGKYEVVDETGTRWTIELNTDETAVFNSSQGSVHYGSWSVFPYEYPCIDFPYGESPYLYFPSGKENVNYSCITEGYLYSSNTNSKAKNPKQRLSIKKVK